jgi:hypothetical protein
MRFASIVGHEEYGKNSVAFGTIIQTLVRPFKGAWTKITRICYSTTGTAHTLTIRKSIGKTTLAANAAAAQAVIVLAATPGFTINGTFTANRAVAGNDYLVVERVDATCGRTTYDLYKVSSVSGLSITLTGNVVGALAKGAQVWLMSLDTDKIPGATNNPTNPKFTTAATAAYANVPPIFAEDMGVASTVGQEEPMIIESNNATATGTLEFAEAIGVIFARPNER